MSILPYIRTKNKLRLCLLACSVPFLASFASENGNKLRLSAEEIIYCKDFPQKLLMSNRLVFSTHPLVNRFRRQYLRKEGLEYLSAIMQRSVLYRDFIIEILKREQLPPELLFLPVIESGFFEQAISKSGAVGIWQFMRNSIRGYNISINEWLDERRDPWKASVAAIKKLKWNYQQLHDWPLALAAYNCGMGKVKAAMKKEGNVDYWYLSKQGYFKRETILYVPKFLAIAEILMRSKELGIDWGDTCPYTDTTTIDIKKAIDISILAKEIGLEASVIKKLNPALYYGITPPHTSYPLRVPSQCAESAKNILANSNKLLLKYYYYKIQSGDTLSALAQHYGITVKSIQSYNRGLKPKMLKIGKTILIPALKSVGTYKGTHKKPYTGNFSGTYIIKQGDSLWALALKYNISVDELAEKNNLSVTSVLSLGTVLKVPKL